jgi:formylglycine-generating enzyme required for sulfatase activity
LGQAHPVALLKPNDLGLFDMHGNVEQWSHNGYDDKTFDRGESVVGASYRVIRGGSWGGVAGDCRAANRDWDAPVARISALGFRLARVPVEGK